jgi:hypothetical protein
MSVTLQMLVPVSDYTEGLKEIKTTHPEIYDQVLAISVTIINEILLPIVKSRYFETNLFTNSDIENFINYCKQEIALLSPLIKVKQASELNLKYYQDLIDRLRKQQRLSEESVESAIKLINIVMNYMRTITIIIQERKSALEKVIENDIDKDDLVQTIYGSTMSILCINVALSKDLKEQERFSSIIEGGYEYVTKLHKYTNQLYMLTQPQELTNIPNVTTTNPNKIAFEKFIQEHLHEEEYRNKYVAFVNGQFQKSGNIRNQLVKEMYDKFGNVPMFVEKVSVNRREILLDTPE